MNPVQAPVRRGAYVAARVRTVYRAWSAASGRIRVTDRGAERRLSVRGDTLSVYRTDGSWTPVRREYWWKALEVVDIPRRPSALLVGLGGGTQIHLLHQVAAPRLIPVIEHDPIIVRVAREWFGLDRITRLEILCTDAETAIRGLARAGRRFDYVMDDVSYADAPLIALPKLLTLAPLVALRGSLVVNLLRTGDPRGLARVLRCTFGRVRHLLHV